MKKQKTDAAILQMQRNAAKAEALLKQLGNANRLMVLCYIVAGEKTVNELAECVGLSQSALSQHLAKLREAGIISAEKRGLKVYYKISSIEAQAVLSLLHVMYCK